MSSVRTPIYFPVSVVAIASESHQDIHSKSNDIGGREVKDMYALVCSPYLPELVRSGPPPPAPNWSYGCYCIAVYSGVPNELVSVDSHNLHS